MSQEGFLDQPSVLSGNARGPSPNALGLPARNGNTVEGDGDFLPESAGAD